MILHNTRNIPYLNVLIIIFVVVVVVLVFLLFDIFSETLYQNKGCRYLWERITCGGYFFSCHQIPERSYDQ